MKYLVNVKNKNHVIMPADTSYVPEGYRCVKADRDGWIPFNGTVCPLPDNCHTQIRFMSGTQSEPQPAINWAWFDESIADYRPILAEKVQEPEPTKPKRLFDDLLERLEASHAAAQALPDLVEQLRDRLKPMGLSVMYLSEFDAAEPEPAVETPQANALCTPSVTDALVYGTSVMKNGKHVPLKDFYAEPAEDMSDWRNWRDNDLIMLKDGIKSGNAIIAGEKYQITHKTKDGFWIDTKMQGSIHIMGRVGDFRFHSRPAKGEK